MNISIQKAADRGAADYGWLKARYYFSFSNYHNPQKIHFGALRVLNDDIIAGGGGFPTHPHDNMEIVTIPFSGAIAHRDNTGGSGTIKAGDVQIMSAGSGVQHSEKNASETVVSNLFQLWVFPKVKNIKPRYDQRTFNVQDRLNKWQVVVSPEEKDKALWINQDAVFSLTKLETGNSLTYENAFKGNGVYLVVINGSVIVNDTVLEKRDAAGITGTDSFTITANADAELLAVEVPMNMH